MSISRLEFNKQCCRFYKKSITLEDSWKLLSIDSHNVSRAFLVEDSVPNFDAVQLMLSKSDLKLIEENGKEKVVSIEYTVIYSESYEVPVMYFSVSNTDGSICGPEQAFKILSIGEEVGARQVITQAEHPLMMRPYYLIHPCRTENLMRNHSDIESGKYLICWLSTVGTLTGLKLDYRFGLDEV